MQTSGSSGCCGTPSCGCELATELAIHALSRLWFLSVWYRADRPPRDRLFRRLRFGETTSTEHSTRFSVRETAGKRRGALSKPSDSSAGGGHV